MNAAKLKERCGTVSVGEMDFVHATGTMTLMADPNVDYWTVADVADHWGVTPQTIRTYRSRKRGELPEPDRMFGRSPVWKPSTIIEFQRPGQGARTDLKDAPPDKPAIETEVPEDASERPAEASPVDRDDLALGESGDPAPSEPVAPESER